MLKSPKIKLTAALFRLVPITLALMAGSTALAQDKTAFVASFSGDWFIFDPQIGASDKTCALVLSKTGIDETDQYSATSTNCVEPLADLSSWDIHDGQLRLFAADKTTPVAVLGGNQSRVTGTFPATKRGLIVERAKGDASTRAMSAALARHRCVYLGFTSKCAPAAALSRPALTEESGAYGSVGVLVNLNVRSQPRADASIAGQLAQGTCLKVNDCAIASDGIWCRARFGDRDGWVHKTALRQKQWPVVTFTNSCAATN
ncbi:SH3 domain-containing protein [Aquicoccus sp. G2-2]|uniref:SH3 domain-containing protein n=1 Tax=Aquicoccus sp. G2-2 TaxID=3092120 RepID=UPI002ADEFF7B|nr:SH3 domain-containing protein [Aquicoccus sp. G2-2]MEA1112272.1 SH3 domain-containing protein [Aquicoccus sp. G2-2]